MNSHSQRIVLPVKAWGPSADTGSVLVTDANNDCVCMCDDVETADALAEILNASGGPAEPSTDRVIDLIYAARRVYRKYGIETDWTEWTDLRDALAAVTDGFPVQDGPSSSATSERG